MTATHRRTALGGVLVGAIMMVSPGAVLCQTRSGSVVAFNKSGTQGIYVFESRNQTVGGVTVQGRLHGRFVVPGASESSWGAWEDHNAPPPRLQSGIILDGPMSDPVVMVAPPVIPLPEPWNTAPHLYVFVVKDGRLYARYWDGSEWHWADWGAPVGKALDHQAPPAIITYQQSLTQYIRAFVIGSDYSLYELVHTGSTSQWTFHGRPPDLALVTRAGVVSYVKDGTRRFYAFVVADSFRLWLRYFDGVAWKWFTSHTEASQYGPPAVITYPDRGLQRIYAFTVDIFLKDLFVNYWNGSAWLKANQHKGLDFSPPTPRDPAAMTFTENGARQIVVCVADSGGVWINAWNGSQWSWHKYLKGGVVVDTVAGAVTYQVDGTRRIAVVMRAQGGNIWLMNLVNGTFGWTSLGQP